MDAKLAYILKSNNNKYSSAWLDDCQTFYSIMMRIGSTVSNGPDDIWPLIWYLQDSKSKPNQDPALMEQFANTGPVELNWLACFAIESWINGAIVFNGLMGSKKHINGQMTLSKANSFYDALRPFVTNQSGLTYDELAWINYDYIKGLLPKTKTGRREQFINDLISNTDVKHHQAISNQTSIMGIDDFDRYVSGYVQSFPPYFRRGLSLFGQMDPVFDIMNETKWDLALNSSPLTLPYLTALVEAKEEKYKGLSKGWAKLLKLDEKSLESSLVGRKWSNYLPSAEKYYEERDAVIWTWGESNPSYSFRNDKANVWISSPLAIWMKFESFIPGLQKEEFAQRWHDKYVKPIMEGLVASGTADTSWYLTIGKTKRYVDIFDTSRTTMRKEIKPDDIINYVEEHPEVYPLSWSLYTN